ncbi:MAG: hypothetical protein H0V90_08385, partial [Blastocatellia bacterium]|nr:hypothetical protein [Blastocatellia bacterium]
CWGCATHLDASGRTIFVLDAHRDDGTGDVTIDGRINNQAELKRFAVRALPRLRFAPEGETLD